MSLAAATRANHARIQSTHNNGKIVVIRKSAPSRVAAMKRHAGAGNPIGCQQSSNHGGAPQPPIPAILGGNEWAAEGCIEYGVAKEAINLVRDAEYCDPVLGYNTGKDILPNHLVRDLKFDNIAELCAVALQHVYAAATGQPSTTGSPAKAAESLNYFLFVEKVIKITQEEFLGPQALAIIIKMMSYLSFSAATSRVLRQQHQSLAKKVVESLGDSCGFEPLSVDVNMIVELNEARARASDVLHLGASQSGAIYGRRQLALLQPMGERSVSASHASRLLVSWSILETRFEGFHPSNQQVAFLANTMRAGIGSSTWMELEQTAGALEGFKYIPPSTTVPLLLSICEESIRRFASGEGSAADIGAVLAVAQHTAAVVACSTAVEELEDKIHYLLEDNGISTEAVK